MPTAFLPNEPQVRAELAMVDQRVEELKAELAKANGRVAVAHRSGATVLSALEAAMAPLMLELARVRRERHAAGCGNVNLRAVESAAAADAGGEGVADGGGADPESEKRHLHLDIEHFQRQAEEQQVAERQRSRELAALRREIAEVEDDIDYERRKSKLCTYVKQLETPAGSGYGGMLPNGWGRKTAEIRTQKKMLNLADERALKMESSIRAMATEAASQQTQIKAAEQRLQLMKKVLITKDEQLQHQSSHNGKMEKKLMRISKSVTTFGAMVAPPGAADAAMPVPGSEPASASGTPARSASTGKLPGLTPGLTF